MFSAKDRGYVLRQCWVDPRQGIAAMIACGGTGYCFFFKMSVVQKSYNREWPCSAKNICIGSYRTFSVDPGDWQMKGYERDADNVSKNITTRLFVLPHPHGNGL